MFNSKTGREFLQKMNRVADFLIISILWFVCSIPLITMGAAFSAMYRTVQSSLLEGRGEVFQTFLRSFKGSLSQATPLWLSYSLLVIIFNLNQMLLANNLANSWLNHFSQVFMLIIIILCTPVLIISLVYIGRFNDKLKVIVENSFLLALTHLKDTIFICFFVAVSALAVYLIPILVVFLPAFLTLKICPRLESIFIHYTQTNI